MGTYESTLHAFSFRSDGTFAYDSRNDGLRLEGTWESTFEVESGALNRGHLDILVQRITVRGESVSRTSDFVYATGQRNRGWWTHLAEEVHAAQEREFQAEFEKAGEPRDPPGAAFTRWWGNPQ